MINLSKVLEICKSSGIVINKSESEYIQYLFESMFNENYNNLLNKNNCYDLLNEFFEKSTIRYCDIEKNNFILEKISKEMSENVYTILFENGRDLHTPSRRDGDSISDVEILRQKKTDVEDGIDTYSGDNVLNIDGETIRFDDQDQANIYKKDLLIKKISN